jgi:hypothetical protein
MRHVHIITTGQLIVTILIVVGLTLMFCDRMSIGFSLMIVGMLTMDLDSGGRIRVSDWDLDRLLSRE